jgi:hypothetical protein
MVLAILRMAGLGVYVVTGLISLAAPAYAEEQTLKQGARSAAPALRQSQKLATDEVLRRGMGNIRQLMIANREAIENDRLSTQDYQRLAAAVNKEAADIVKNCKLSKEADKAFHSIVLADLTQSTELLRASPKVQVQRAGAFGVLQSLRNYGEYFQHAGWDMGK